MNAKGKTVDKTYLSINAAEERGFLHRDYIAHCFRWTHVVKWLTQLHRYKDSVILDVGCGREMPLAKMLHSSRLIPTGYYGVDVGPIPDTTLEKFNGSKFPMMAWEKTDVCDIKDEDLPLIPNVCVSFEVFEHVEPKHLCKMLTNMRLLCHGSTTYFFSTPCWDRVNVADNHVNEMTFEAMGCIFENMGFQVDKVHGTFASIKDYKSRLTPCHLDLFNQLSDYYDSNVLSCIFAPLYPQYSRNCLWQLSTPEAPEKHFGDLLSIEKPWGSSELWSDMQLIKY